MANIIGEFASSLKESVPHNAVGMVDALKLIQDNILRSRRVLKDLVTSHFHAIDEIKKDSHRVVQPEVTSSWEDVYDECGSAKGK
jgi:hypothetical protein